MHSPDPVLQMFSGFLEESNYWNKANWGKNVQELMSEVQFGKGLVGGSSDGVATC